MKFGKALMRAIDSCNPEWAPYWLDYKELKNKIKHLDNKKHFFRIDIKSDRSKMRRLLGSSDLERAFFDTLNTRLKQTSVLYESELKNIEVRFSRLKYHLTILQHTSENPLAPLADLATRALEACVQVVKDAVDLEKFVVTQYDGFNKILKKHDKCTSYITRSPYMENVVNRDAFAKHEALTALIEQLMDAYDTCGYSFMAAHFFRGTTVEQDGRWGKADEKLMAKMAKDGLFAPILNSEVNMSKVNYEIMIKWISEKLTELLGFEDEILINMVGNMMQSQEIHGRKLQLDVTGFLGKRAGGFVEELWTLLLDAQTQTSGIPSAFIESKKAEILVREERKAEQLARQHTELDKTTDTSREKYAPARENSASGNDVRQSERHRSRSRDRNDRNDRSDRSERNDRSDRSDRRRSRSPPRRRYRSRSPVVRRRSPTPPRRRSPTPPRRREERRVVRGEARGEQRGGGAEARGGGAEPIADRWVPPVE